MAKTNRIFDEARLRGWTAKRAALAVLLALTLATSMALAGCAQGRGTSTSSAVSSTVAASVASGTSATSAASVSAPSSLTPPEATAEIADVTTVAYLGPAGTYTEEAAKLFFGDNDELAACATVADALARVLDGSAAYAVIPQENTLGGPVADYIDALIDAEGIAVVGEVVLPIRQTLMGLPGTDLSQVKRVYSHKQGLVQSATWLDENLPSAERVEKASTAAAAQEVAEGGDPTVVAIAAPGAAELYGLEVLRENVSMSDANETRFYVVSLRPNELEGYDCAVLVASIEADELPGVLDKACQNGAELACLHDRPEGSALGTYRYVVELTHEGGFTSEEIDRISAIDQVEYRGSYRVVKK